MIALIDKPRFPASYKRLQKNPIQENRRPTNVYCLCIVLPLIVFAWIGCSIYDASTFPPLSSRLLKQYARIGSTILNLVKCNFGVVAGCTLLSTVLVCLFILLVKGITKFFVIVAWALVFVACCFMFSMVLVLFLPSLKVPAALISFFAVLLLLPISYEIALLISIRATGLDVLSEIIKQTCRVFFSYPVVLLLSLLLYAMNILVVGLFIIAMASIPFRNYATYIILHCINVLGAIFLVNFIGSLGLMIISQYYAYWYWSKGKKRMSNSAALRNAIKIVRNHIGTVAFGATFILPTCLAMYLTSKWKQSAGTKSENGFVKLMSELRLIWEITDFAMIQTSVQGFAFRESAEKSIDLILHNASKYLAVLDVFNIALYIGKSAVYLLVVVIMTAALEDQIYEYPQYIRVIAFATVSATNFIDYSLSVAVKTILLCVFEDLKVNDGSDEKPYHMSDKLQILLTESNR